MTAKRDASEVAVELDALLNRGRTSASGEDDSQKIQKSYSVGSVLSPRGRAPPLASVSRSEPADSLGLSHPGCVLVDPNGKAVVGVAEREYKDPENWV